MPLAMPGCAQTQKSPQGGDAVTAALHANLEAQIQSCRQKTGYVPLADSERRLAPNELAYRQCVYQGIDTVVLPTIPFDSIRKSYGELIAEDKRLTDQVAAGTITRGDRQAQIDSMKQILDRDYAALVDATVEHQRQDDMERTRAYIQQQRELWQVQQQITDVHTSIVPALR